MPTALSLLAPVAPGLTARIAYPLLVTPGPRLPMRDADAPIMSEARESSVHVRGRRVVVYEWGTGADVVVLVHGWRGRASQFGSLVRELRAEGYRVVSFDAPACGASEGVQTDAGDYVDVLRLLQARYGAFAGIVGHSFGSLAALVAIKEGIVTARMAGVASIPDADHLMAAFTERLGLTRRVRELLVARFQAKRFPNQADLRVRFSGVLEPVRVPTLFVHDVGDREVGPEASERLHAAHGSSSQLLLTSGQGHARILGADETLDAIVGFLAGEPARVSSTAL